MYGNLVVNVLLLIKFCNFTFFHTKMQPGPPARQYVACIRAASDLASADHCVRLCIIYLSLLGCITLLRT